MSKLVSEMTDTELAAELERRKNVAELSAQAHAQAQRKEKFQLLLKHREALLALVPHSRTSCSDGNVSNSFTSATRHPRCPRCALLELNESPWSAENFDFDLHLSFYPLKTEAE